MKNSASLLYGFILVIGDFIAVAAAFILAYVIRVKLDDRPLLEPVSAWGYSGVIAVLLLFWIIIYALLGLYKSAVYENRFKEVFLILVGSFIGILFLIGTEYVLNRAIFPARLVTAYGFGFAFLLTLLFRTVIRAARRILFRYGRGVNRVLIVGATDITEELAQHLSAKHSGYRVLGVVGDRRTKYSNVDSSIQFKDFEEASKAIHSEDITSIVQTELFADQTRNDEILTFAQEHHIAYRFVPGNSKLFVGSIDVNLFQGIPTISVHQTALTGWGRVVKRLFDLVISSLLLIVLSPIFLIVYFAIKIVDFGPSFYAQERLTRFDQTINIYKFRSFRRAINDLPVDVAYDKLGHHALAKRYRGGDDTIPVDKLMHPIGAFLRKTSLDELPQIFNVFKGDLSLVGPRPLVAREMKTFHSRHQILSVKPGITGLAVVSGRRNISFEERRKLDMYYAQNWSFLMDLVIILKTAVQVVVRTFSQEKD